MSKSNVQMGDVVSNAPVIETGSENQQPVENTQQNDEQVQETPISRHQQAMRDIIARREERRNEELRYGEDLANDARVRAGLEAENLMAGSGDGLGTPENGQGQPSPQSNEQVQAPQTTAPAQTAPQTNQQPSQSQPQNETLVRVNINGTVLELPQHELESLVAEGARSRLASVQQPQQQEQVRAPAQQQVQQPVARPQQQQIDFNTLFSQEDAQRTYERISSGSEEDGANAIRDMAMNIARTVAAQTQQPHVDVAAIERQVIQRVRAEDTQRRNLETIGAEFPEVFNNPDLGKFAGMKVAELADQYARAGIQKPTLDVWREACNTTRQLLGSNQSPPVSETQQAGVSPSNAQDVVINRQVQNKETLPRVPTGANVRSQGQRSAQPQSRADVVNDMRKARGQAPMR